jgi:hypothetical protein
MKADIEMSLCHDGDLWVCHNEAMQAKGSTLLDLDREIQRALQESGEYLKGSRVRVFMGFDFDTIPTWLRQYHTHYFNRTVTVEL